MVLTAKSHRKGCSAVKAIITGHSKGLGAALTAELLKNGARVLGISRSKTERAEDRLEQVAADLADPEAVGALLGEDGPVRRFLAGASGGPLLLINNAGMVEPVGPAGTLEPQAIIRAIALNVTGPLVLADAFIAATDGIADRRIMHVSSGAGRQPYAGWSIYGATKAALDHHARCAAADDRPGLRIASVAPGVVDTAMQATLRALPKEKFGLRDRFVALKEKGDLILPADCAARMVSYLLMPEFGASVIADIRELA